MNTRCSPEEFAEAILLRSVCAVQVGACLADSHGIFAWGWNHMGNGFGEHAEVHCLRRANRDRAEGSTIYVASTRMRTGRPVTSKPCEKCQGWIEAFNIHKVWFRGGDGLWRLQWI